MTTTLNELLTPAQLMNIKNIMLKMPGPNRSRELREYLAENRAYLENRGVVPEYLAYVIEFMEQTSMERFIEEESKHAKNN